MQEGQQTILEENLDKKKVKIENEEQAKAILKDLDGKEFIVDKIERKERKKNPVPPFITSRLQQEAARNDPRHGRGAAQDRAGGAAEPRARHGRPVQEAGRRHDRLHAIYDSNRVRVPDAIDHVHRLAPGVGLGRSHWPGLDNQTKHSRYPVPEKIPGAIHGEH